MKKPVRLAGTFYGHQDGSKWEDCEDGSVKAILRNGELVIESDEDDLTMLAKLSSTDGFHFAGKILDPRFRGTVGRMEGYLYKSIGGDYAFWMDMIYDDTGFGGHYVVYLDVNEDSR